jgi:CO/xanthine dehydrogenase Mo-binding subunit
MSARPPDRLEQRIVIESTGTVIARSGKVEYGQGIRTGFARLVAEELAVPVERVRIELGETDVVPWDMGTFGSMSTAVDGRLLRAAAAFAREILIERAAERLAVPASELTVKDGCVVGGGHAIRYQELVANRPLSGEVPADFSTVAQIATANPVPMRLEAPDVVTGRARYPSDVRLPGMVRGHVLHPPIEGSGIVSMDDRLARSMPGVLDIIREGDFVGVVAERDEQALAAAQAIRIQWKSPDIVASSPVDLSLRRDDSVDDALANAARHFAAEYELPHIAHGSIGPSSAVADVRNDEAHLYVALQRPFGLRDEVSKLLGLPPERVHVHPQMMSGTYGRGNMPDAAIEAARLSRLVKRPVLVQWTRSEEFHCSPHRPLLLAKVEAGLDSGGTILAWRYDAITNPHTYGGLSNSPRLLEITSGRNALPPYRLPKAEVSVHVRPGTVRTGAFRSLAAALNVFAIESCVDELAHEAKQDPIAFRFQMIDDPRLRNILILVRDRSNWDNRSADLNHGYGVACAIYHGTYIAQIAKVIVDPVGRVRLVGVWCAVDAGHLVHPDGALNQIEGGIQQAASWTLLEELRHDGAEVKTSTWQDYPIATFRDAPDFIDVVFRSEAHVPSTGTGEPGSVPTAAAIANAVFAACGRRIRRLPLMR